MIALKIYLMVMLGLLVFALVLAGILKLVHAFFSMFSEEVAPIATGLFVVANRVALLVTVCTLAGNSK